MISAYSLDLKNVVAVRFSVRNRSFERKFLSSERARERWFEFRAKLYQASLGASLAAQSVKPLAVFLFFDAADVGLVERYFSSRDFTPVFETESHDSLMGELLLHQGFSRDVVLSRIDSDDIVERDYLKNINSLLTERHLSHELDSEAMVICKSGYRSNFTNVQRVFHISPPFLSLYFRTYSGQGAYFNHTKLELRSTQIIEDEEAEWLQIVHGTNVANKFKPPSPGDWRVSHFGVRESRFGQIVDFDSDWFRHWAGIEPIPKDWFDFSHAPLDGVLSSVRFMVRRLLRQS